MAEENQTPPEHTDTGMLPVATVFGPTWRFALWVRRQFTLTSVATLIGTIGAIGGWALSLQTRVVVLETKVIPFVQDQGQLAVMNQRLDDHERRIGVLEDDYNHAQEEAGTPPVGSRGKRWRRR